MYIWNEIVINASVKTLSTILHNIFFSFDFAKTELKKMVLYLNWAEMNSFCINRKFSRRNRYAFFGIYAQLKGLRIEQRIQSKVKTYIQKNASSFGCYKNLFSLNVYKKYLNYNVGIFSDKVKNIYFSYCNHSIPA